MPVVPIAALVISAGAGIYSTVVQKRAADASANTANAVANYNSKVDIAGAEQNALDTRANIEAMRRDAAVYMSRQRSSFVAAGIRGDTGSPLVLQATTAGRLAMREQQAYNDSEAKQRRLYSAASAGIAEGNAQADAYHSQGIAAVLGGASRLAGQLGGAYSSGMFSGSGTNDLSSQLRVGEGTSDVSVTRPF